MKRIFVIILAILLLVVFAGNALADDSRDKAPRGDPSVDYTYINYATISLSISGGGYA